MTVSAQKGGDSMSGKIYKGKIKSIERARSGRNKGKRRVLLSINGIGDAFINWNKTPKGVEFPKGANIEVKMRKHEDGRWFVVEIISINGKILNSNSKLKHKPRTKQNKNRRRF